MKRNKLLLSFGSLSVFSAIPFIAAKCDDTSEKDNKNPINPGNPGETTENQVVKVELGKLGEKTKEELNKLAKDGVIKAQVVTVLKTEKGLENLTESDLAKVEFKDNKLTIEANKESKLVSGTYEYSAQRQTPDAVIDLSKVQLNGEVKALLKAEAKEKPDKAKVLAALKKNNNFAKLTESDFEVSFKDSTLTVKATAGSKVIKGELSISNKTELDNITLTEEVKKGLQTELSKDSFKPEDIVKVLKGHQELKDLDAKDVEVKEEGNKLTVAAKSTSAKFTGTLNFVFKVMLDKVMTEDVKKELESEAKDKPNTANLVNSLKKLPGLVGLSSNDVSVKFESNKLVITATESSELIMGSISVNKKAASSKINLSTLDLDEKQKKDLLGALGDASDEENDSRKTSIWFTLNGIFKGKKLDIKIEEDEFEIIIGQNNNELVIKAKPNSENIVGELKITNGTNNSHSDGKMELKNIKPDEVSLKKFWDKFTDGNFAKNSVVELLKTIKGLEDITTDDIKDVKADKKPNTTDEYTKVTIVASDTSKLISGNIVLENKE
ncbi:variable surface lipoprotein [Mycoplasmopsis agalactiae]|uniref:variable surface lipoprotein n=1 Tax=Mycoplasmopsis agalactiae TaxID=2110 RepID=UPI001F999AFA|nr:variable surface lipoprotein [Mycoplasmopsis agalactiae]MCE6061538.1 variable surface lipoprotein [Mycoplasmopsis agalactiae]